MCNNKTKTKNNNNLQITLQITVLTEFKIIRQYVNKKVKGHVYLLMETATWCQLSYGITQRYLPPDTSEHILP